MENNAIQPLNNTMALSKSSQTDFANNLIKSVTKGDSRSHRSLLPDKGIERQPQLIPQKRGSQGSC